MSNPMMKIEFRVAW